MPIGNKSEAVKHGAPKRATSQCDTSASVTWRAAAFGTGSDTPPRCYPDCEVVAVPGRFPAGLSTNTSMSAMTRSWISSRRVGSRRCPSRRDPAGTCGCRNHAMVADLVLRAVLRHGMIRRWR